MRKFLKTLTLATVIGVVLSTNAFAETLAKAEAMDIIKSLDSKQDFSNIIHNGKPFAVMKKTSKTLKFDDLSGTSVVDKGYGFQINKSGQYDGQCVSLVRALTGNSVFTGGWKKGQQITPSSSIKPGTLIATFPNGSNYDTKNKTGKAHTGIYLGKTSSYIWILDQNWREASHDDSGTTGIHKIYFNENGGVTDAYFYYVVE